MRWLFLTFLTIDPYKWIRLLFLLFLMRFSIGSFCSFVCVSLLFVLKLVYCSSLEGWLHCSSREAKLSALSFFLPCCTSRSFLCWRSHNKCAEVASWVCVLLVNYLAPFMDVIVSLILICLFVWFCLQIMGFSLPGPHTWWGTMWIAEPHDLLLS